MFAKETNTKKKEHKKQNDSCVKIDKYICEFNAYRATATKGRNYENKLE